MAAGGFSPRFSPDGRWIAYTAMEDAGNSRLYVVPAEGGARKRVVEQDFDSQWRLVIEFLKEYHQEPAVVRLRLLDDGPGPTGDERWDVLLAGLAEHLAMRDGRAAPSWSATRGLRRFWFPFDTPSARAQAIVHAPAAFRRRGVFVADYEIDAA